MAQIIDHTTSGPADGRNAIELARMEPGIHVSLTHEKLNAASAIELVKSPKAGAVVVFLGSTRDSVDGKTVTYLEYSAYAPLALRSLLHIARRTRAAYPAIAITIVHRLGRVNVCEESIAIAVSSAHRATAFAAGENCLERVKKRKWKSGNRNGSRTADYGEQTEMARLVYQYESSGVALESGGAHERISRALHSVIVRSYKSAPSSLHDLTFASFQLYSQQSSL